MTNKEKIRKDLKNIRYYFSRKKSFDNYIEDIGENSIVEKIEKYNQCIKYAEPRLYDLYVSLYLNNNTQESLSERWGFSVEYLSRLNGQLVKFFANYFEKENIDV